MFRCTLLLCLSLVGCGELSKTLDVDASTADATRVDAKPCPFVPGSITFNALASPQEFVVPECVFSIVAEVYGAEGGLSNNAPGGKGGFATARIQVTPGEVLQVRVGLAGISANSSAGGYNGGGGVVSVSGFVLSGVGGDASDVRRGSELSGRLIVAGGGGGGGYSTSSQGFGGAGGGLGGGTGSGGTGTPGHGGTQTDGGTVGTNNAPFANEPGSFGVGGRCFHDAAPCGGGGGGWYGGGTGGFGGGAGGSGYVDAPGNSEGSMMVGVRSGNGSVVVSY